MTPLHKQHTPETKARVFDLYISQGLSAATVAAMMGLPSRNAVIGIANRAGWRRGEEVIRQNIVEGRKRQARPERRTAPPPPPVPAPPVIVERSAPVPFVARAGCHYVVSAPGDEPMVCNAQLWRGPYCLEHHRVCYRAVG